MAKEIDIVDTATGECLWHRLDKGLVDLFIKYFDLEIPQPIVVKSCIKERHDKAINVENEKDCLVRIKSFAEIKKTLDFETLSNNGIKFDSIMEPYCGKEAKILSSWSLNGQIQGVYLDVDNKLSEWSINWLEREHKDVRDKNEV